MSGIMAILAGSSGITLLDTQTVTRGTTTTGTDPYYNWSGYKSASPAIGSISDGTSNVYSGATITGLYFTETGQISPPNGIVTRQLIWYLTSEVANSGWTSMLVGTTNFLRADAVFNTGTGYSKWTWTIAINDPFVSEGDPFSASTTVKWY